MEPSNLAQEIFGQYPFRHLVEGINDFAILLLDRQGTIVSWNHGAREIFGYEEHEVIRRPFSMLFLPQDVADGTPNLELAKAEAAGRAEDIRWHQRKNGERFWANGVTAALRDAKGSLTGFSKITRDDTAKKLLEDELREETEVLETVNRVGQLLTAELDLQNLVQALTDAATQITGAQFGSFFYNIIDQRGERYMLYTLSGVPEAAFEHFPIPRNTDIFSHTFKGEGTVLIDDVEKDPRYGKNWPYYGMPKGHLPVTSYLAVPVISRSGEVLGGLFFGHSAAGVFTHRHVRIVEGLAAQTATAMDNARLFATVKSEQSRIQLIQERNSAVLDRITDAFIALDRDWRFTYLNRPAEALFGRTREYLLGRCVWHEFPEAVGGIFEENYNRAVTEQAAVTFEYFYQLLDTWFEVRVFPSDDGVSVYFHNINARKRSEFGLKSLTLELERQSRVFDTMLSSVEDFTYILDRDARFIYANQALIRLWGLTLDQVAGRSFIELPYSDELATKLTRQIHEVINTGHSVRDEVSHTSPTGGTAIFEYIFSPVLAPDGTVEAVAGSTRDITSLKHSEENFKERARSAEFVADIALTLNAANTLEEMLQRCAEIIVARLGAAFARIWTVNAGESVLQLNASAGMYTDLNGPHARIAIGEYKIGQIAQSRRPHFTNNVAEDSRISDPEWAIRERMAAFAGYPLIIENKLLGVVAMFSRRQLSAEVVQAFGSVANSIALGIERKRMESERSGLIEQVEWERSRLAYLFEKAPAFVATLRGPEHVFELTNPAYLQTVGNRELIGRPAREALPEVEDQGFFELLDDVFQTGEPHVGKEVRIMFQRNRGGPLEERFVDFVYQPIFEADGSVRGIFVHGQDISEQVTARKAVEEASRSKDEFLSTLSHELRTPLTAILGWARMLSSRQVDEAGMERALEIIERNAYAQQQLIEDILDVSRVISGKMRLDVRPIDLATVIEAAVDSVLPAAEAREIRLQRVLDSGANMVSGDPTRLQQVIFNLLSNAIKFTPKGGRVQISLEHVGSSVEIIVSDSGQGIVPELLPHIFERFRQGDSTITRSHGGLGLGLAIVRHLVELHGGTVQAESAGADQGSTFTVRLPVLALRPTNLLIANMKDLAHPAADQFIPLLNPPNLNGLSVLVVDDEDDTRLLVQAVLEQCAARVITARSAAEALELIQRARPDVLISDLGMPDEDGYSLIRKVRALRPSEGGHTPAAALTAYARVEDRMKVLRAGFQVHVPKPVDPAELIAVIESLTNWVVKT
jgi:PAS domain S-box-containing protein